jgi:hypothetical protein
VVPWFDPLVGEADVRMGRAARDTFQPFLAMVEDRAIKSRFLTVYDYSTGGVWSFVLARTAKESEETFRDLKVVETVPAWLDDDERANIEKDMLFDIDDIKSDDWIARLLRNS